MKVVTYDMGSSIQNYDQLNLHLNPSTEDQEISEGYFTQYENAQKKTAELLCNKAEVYFLQGLGTNISKIPLIEKLFQNNNYTIIFQGKNKNNSAIALNKNQFKDFKYHSITIKASNKQACYKEIGVTVISATDKKTNRRIVFASAHIPDFEYEKKQEVDINEGHHICFNIAEHLSSIAKTEKCSIEIIGANMNASPEMDQKRFEIFTNKGFQIIRSGKHTNVCPKSTKYPQRELDFILVKSHESFFSKILGPNVRVNFKTFDTIGWSTETNCSNHIPVFAEIQIKPKKSYLYSNNQMLAFLAVISICAFIASKSIKIKDA